MIEPATTDSGLRALVLTAGLGTRLEPLTSIRAKAAVPVNGDTLARRVIRWLVSQNVRDLVLNLHHLPASIAASVGDGSDLEARVRYSWENPVLGSAGGPRRALPLMIDAKPAVIGPIRGDAVLEIECPVVGDLLELIEDFRRPVFAVESHDDEVLRHCGCLL